MQQDKRSNPYVTGTLIAAFGAAMPRHGPQPQLVGGAGAYGGAGLRRRAGGIEPSQGATRRCVLQHPCGGECMMGDIGARPRRIAPSFVQPPRRLARAHVRVRDDAML